MNEEQFQNIIQAQARMEEQIKTLFRQQDEIKELTKSVQKIATALEKQGVALQSTEKKVDSVKRDVDEIKSKPGKRWDAIMAAVISGVVAFLIGHFGLK